MISHLGRYEIISELGQGAMGIVYKATDPLIDRIVAIKTINLGLALAQEERDEYEARFYQEAKAAGRLSHPNIVTVYDVGKSGDVAYIAMEFLQGRELRDILDEMPHLPVSQVLDIVMQVALGLEYAHEHGIVHRDVKPSNIMVVRNEHVKITDFGIARMASSSVRTQAGMVLGSPKYMSPEQVLGKSIDQRTDIFSLGVMLYEMLTGQAPFVGDTINAIMQQTMNTDPPAPGTLNPEVPAMLNLIVAKAIAKILENRYQNAKEFADDLRACRDALPRPSVPTVTAKTQPDNFNAPVPNTSQSGTRIEVDQEISNSEANKGVSRHFDSFEATMRLAEMTAPGDAGNFSRTLKMTSRNPDSIKQSSQQSEKPQDNSQETIVRAHHLQANKNKVANGLSLSNNRKLLLLAIVLLVALGLAYVL